MRRLCLAALLAATMPLTPLTAHPAPPDSSAPTATSANPQVQRDHIRTTLHGDAGPVVVLIPGMSTPGMVWDDTVARLSPNHRLLVVEMRGFDGERGSDNEQAEMIDGIIADIAADLAARDLGPATLAGHSFGGLLAMKFALAHPNQTSRVLVIDALPFFGTVFDPAATVASITPRADQMRAAMISSAEAMRAAAKGEAKGQIGNWSIIQAHADRIAQWSATAEPLVVAQALHEDLLTDLRPDIAAISVPVTVLYQVQAGADAARRRYETDYAALPGVRLVPVERSAHFIMLDRPDAFDAELAAQLQAHVKGQLAPYEYPKEIEFIDQLPMTTTGKVQRRVLRLQEEARARQQQGSAAA